MSSPASPNVGRTGGPAAAGGMSFQAAVTAIALVALACGHRLLWLPDADDTPTEVWSETHGPGDDVRLRLRDGKVAEIQCKKGLSRSEHLWEALLALAGGVASGAIDWGVMAVCPQSSGTIRTDLATDLRRFADGRVDGLTPIGQEFLDRLQARGLDVAQVCGKLVIQVVAAIDGDAADIRAAYGPLAALLARAAEADTAWRALERDALALIRRRGARNAAAVAEVLRGAGVSLADSGGPAILASRLAAWTTSLNAGFKIIGVGKALPTAESLLDVSCRLLDGTEQPDGDLKAALDRYHNPPSRMGGLDSIDPTTLGRFYRLAVLLAGPGMGKSTLMKRLALEYARDGYPVLRVSLREVAQRQRAGESFMDAAFNCGLASSGSSPFELRQAFQDWVLLGDGLDECGEMQEQVAEGLIAFAAAFPRARVVATSRPVGYQPALLAAWRHYELIPFDTSSASTQVAYLLADILPDDDPRQSEVFKIARRELSDAQAKKLGARSAFLLSLAASLVARGDTLTGSKADLYERLLNLIEKEPPARAGLPVESRPVRRSVLGLLGWASALDPLQGRDEAIRVVAGILGPQLDVPPLKARDIADRCLEHWERLGVIETLRHGGAELVAFVHKTFGEYLAACHLADLPTADRDREIDARLDDPSWNEVLGFSAALGLTDALIARALQGDADEPGVARVRWALSLAASNPPLQEDLAERLAALAFRHVDDPSRDLGIKVANPCARFYASRPGRGAPPAALRASPKVWVQLTAWCCTISAGPGTYALGDLETFLRGLPKLDLTGWRNKRRNFLLDLGDDRESRLAERLVVLAARELLQRSDRATADEILTPIFATNAFGSFEYLREVEGLFAEFQHSYPLEAAKIGRTIDDMFPPDDREAARAAFAKLASAFGVPDEEVPADERTHLRPPLELDAFLKLTDLDSPGPEVWGWAKAEADDALRHLLSNVLILTGLPEQTVRRQARVQMRQTEDETSRYAGFPYLPHIDLPPMDWAGARGLDLDAALLGEALHHPVNAVALLAARLIESGLPDEDRAALGRDALERGRGLVAAYGALLLADFDRPLTSTLVLSRLEASGGSLRHLYQLLPKLPVTDDAALEAALRNGLLSDWWTAAEAAKAALHFAAEGRAIMPVLLNAWEHWRKIETEWTKTSRPSPSPREALLKAIQQLDGVETRWLVDAVVEPRTHIAGGADLLIDRLRDRPDDLRQTISRMSAGEVQTSLLRTILGARLTLSSSEIDWIEQLADDPDDDRREIAGVLAKEGYLADRRAAALAEKLIADPEEHVRELGREVRGKLHTA